MKEKDEDHIIKWDITEDETPTINFRKKRNFKNLKGAFSTDKKTNSVELKKSLYEMRKYEVIQDLIEADKEFKEGKSIVFKSLKELDKSLDEKIKDEYG